MPSLWPMWVLQIAITVWLATISIWDLREHRIPNGLILPFMLGALVWRAYSSITQHSPDVLIAIAAWAVIFLIWRFRVFGGGDAKLLMGLFALFPNAQFFVFFCVLVFVVTLPLALYEIVQRLRGRGPTWRPQTQGSNPLAATEALPTQGRPFAWVFALPGVIYLWLPL